MKWKTIQKMMRNKRCEKKKKLGRSSGFSLSEALITLLIACILIGGMTTHLVTSVRVYNSTLIVAECQALIDTINTELVNMLRYSNYVSESNGIVIFSNERTYSAGGNSFYEYNIIDEHLEVNRDGFLIHTSSSGEDDTSDGQYVVLPSLYNSLRMTEFSLEYEETTREFSFSYSIANDGKVLKTVENYTFVRFGE